MAEKLGEVERHETTAVHCRHHWIIDTPAGRVSRGECKLCGETKEFLNSPLEGGFWEDDSSAHQTAASGRYPEKSSTGLWSESEEDPS